MSVFSSNTLIFAPECWKCILRGPDFKIFPVTSNFGHWQAAPLPRVFFLLHLLKILLKTLWCLLYLKQNVQIVTLPCPMECRCISCSNLNPVMSIVGNNIHYKVQLPCDIPKRFENSIHIFLLCFSCGSLHRRPRRSMCHWMNILIFTWTN